MACAQSLLLGSATKGPAPPSIGLGRLAIPCCRGSLTTPSPRNTCWTHDGQACTPGVPSAMSTGCAGIPPEERPKGKVARNRTAPVKKNTCLHILYTNKAAPIRSSARYFGTSLAMSIGFELVPLLPTLIFISTMAFFKIQRFPIVWA